MSIFKSKIDEKEDYRRLSLYILSRLNVIRIHESGDYYQEIDTLSDDLINQAISIAKSKISDLDTDAFKSILIDVYKEAGTEIGDTHFNE